MEKNKDTIQNQSFKPRSPVVVILGHVDSGKTSLLDYIRKTNVVAGESGGITQHIGAYQVEVSKLEQAASKNSSAVNSGLDDSVQRKITFIDTPGHEAFSAMRMRGAKVADIAILVVDGAAGVQPQTKEAISHIKAANIPMIVAINKTDRPEVIPEKTKTALAKEDVLVESMGGNVPSINISAKTGKGVQELLDMILLVGEMEQLKADVSCPAQGVVIESYLDSKRGPLATVIISEGTLEIGDVIGTSSAFGKVKNLENFKGIQQETALPSEPVVVIGFSRVPKVGETFNVFQNMEEAQSNVKTETVGNLVKNPLPQEGQRVLNLIIKFDVDGSIEAIGEVLKEIPQDKVILNVLKSEVGEVNESDVKLARSARAIIFGFRVKTNVVARQMAERDKIRIMSFDIIYDFVEGIRKSMERIIVPEDVRTDLGKIRILAVFMIDKSRQIVGGRVSFGEIKRGGLIEVTRNEEVVGKGKMVNLQKNKRDADRVVRGEECGILFEGNVKIETGDILNIYTETKVRGEL